MNIIKIIFQRLLIARFNFFHISTASLFIILNGFVMKSYSQVETEAWGNIRGIRVDGELMKFETSIRIVQKGWTEILQTAKEKQDPIFKREAGNAVVNSSINNLSFNEIVKDSGDGVANVSLELTADSNMIMEGAFFCVELPNDDFSDAKIDFINQVKTELDTSEMNNQPFRMRFIPKAVNAKGIKVNSVKRKLEISASRQTEIYIQHGNTFTGNGNTQIYFAVIPGEAPAGKKSEMNFGIKISGIVDDNPVELKLDASKPGRIFDGIGGNFRLQNPINDPPVINYCLDNLNITWARVELPWFNWQREEGIDPFEAAQSGHLDQRVTAAMEIAQKLSKRNIPLIISVWYPPRWAITGDIIFRRKPGDPFGNPLNQMKMRKIEKSIASYLLYLKDKYGVEPELFSFNESDLGINVRQTAGQHAELIKSFGAYFASAGLSTKMLLGDNSDASTYGFVETALKDPDTYKYIGAVSFHSWRGCDDVTLSIWYDIAKELNVPLIVGEGSNDAAAWKYPSVFLEPSYALDEINLYARICSICQPKTILQWQMTSDYSILTGDGIYDIKGPLKPTQRFWNLKQLGLTPKGSFYLPVSSNGKNIICTAYGDIKDSIYTIHLVNSGGARNVTLTGFPESVNNLRIYITDKDRGMEEEKSVNVKNGKAEFKVEPACFTTLISR